MRQLLTYWPPRIVSAKCTFQLSRSSTFASAAATPAFGHDRVGLAEERLADQADLHAGRRGLDGRAQPGAAGANHQHVVFVRFESRHRMRKSVQMPIEQSRTYTSVKATQKRLNQAKS